MKFPFFFPFSNISLQAPFMFPSHVSGPGYKIDPACLCVCQLSHG